MCCHMTPLYKVAHAILLAVMKVIDTAADLLSTVRAPTCCSGVKLLSAKRRSCHALAAYTQIQAGSCTVTGSSLAAWTILCTWYSCWKFCTHPPPTSLGQVHPQAEAMLT